MIQHDLILAAQSGDREAIESLLRAVELNVYRTAFYMLGNESDAHDACQEALIRIYTKLGSFEFKASFKSWCNRITSNVCIDIIRKRRSFVPVEDVEYQLVADDNIALEVELKDLTHDLLIAIQQLPDSFRVILTLRYIHNNSYHEIAEIVQLPINTVKSYLHRARQQVMRTLLNNEKGGA